jgi:hypothetical protein
MSYDRYGKTSRKERFGSAFIVTRSAEKTNGIGGFVNARLNLFGQSHEIPNLYVVRSGIFATVGALTRLMRPLLCGCAAANSWPQNGVRLPVDAQDRTRTRAVAGNSVVTVLLTPPRPGAPARAAYSMHDRQRCD